MDGDADADRDLDGVRPDHHGLDDPLQNFLRDLRRVFGLMKVGKDHSEFVAAVTRDRVGLPHAAAQALRDLDQEDVGDIVPQGVIDDLEAVDVDEQNGHALSRALRGEQAHFQALNEETAVRQLRQRIVVCLKLDLLLHALSIGDVDSRQVQKPVVALAEERDVRQEEYLTAVPAASDDFHPANGRRLIEPLAHVFDDRGSAIENVAQVVVPQLVRDIADESGERRVAIDDAAGDSRQTDAGGILLEQQAVSRFRIAYGLFGGQPCGGSSTRAPARRRDSGR